MANASKPGSLYDDVAHRDFPGGRVDHDAPSPPRITDVIERQLREVGDMVRVLGEQCEFERAREAADIGMALDYLYKQMKGSHDLLNLKMPTK